MSAGAESRLAERIVHVITHGEAEHHHRRGCDHRNAIGNR
jgi:hypothetical protein